MQVQKSFAERPGLGVLYLVGTPIGNLEDMTYRGVRTLREADIIAAEDTRQTRKLLSHFEIAGRLVSYHEHNKDASGPELVRLMEEEGLTVALVSDAGMPAISDPGFDLARLAIERGIPVVPIPGANAALSALVMSGLATDRFMFTGFLPREKRKLSAELEELSSVPASLIFYESPHRVLKTLDAMREVWGGGRRAALAREITKRHEEAARGTLDELCALLEEHPPLGEYVIVVERGTSGAGAGDSGDAAPWWSELTVQEHVERYSAEGQDRKTAMKKAAADRGVSKRDIYRELLE